MAFTYLFTKMCRRPADNINHCNSRQHIIAIWQKTTERQTNKQQTVENQMKGNLNKTLPPGKFTFWAISAGIKLHTFLNLVEYLDRH